MKKLLLAAGVATLVAASPAIAAKPLKIEPAGPSLGGGGCSSDLLLSAGSTLTSCYGRVDKNALNNADNTIINTALTALGYTGPAITYSAVPLTDIMSGLNGSQSINFPGVFNGTIYLGAHYGNGQGGPGNSTTFYRINAMNLDLIGLTLKASSTVTVFARIPAPAVPEPATWAMMLVGFGMTAASLRYVRRGTKVAIA